MHAPVAQLDRVPGFEPGGREFESLRARHFSMSNLSGVALLFSIIEVQINYMGVVLEWLM